MLGFGDACPPRCPECQGVTNVSWVDPTYRPPVGAPDVSCTYDNRLVVSARVREVFPPHETLLIPLPAAPGFSVLLPRVEVRFDSATRRTRFLDPCPVCQRYGSVVGATPVFLLDKVPADDCARTDIAFGSGDEQYPLVLVGVGLANRLDRAGLRGLELQRTEQAAGCG